MHDAVSQKGRQKEKESYSRTSQYNSGYALQIGITYRKPVYSSVARQKTFYGHWYYL